MAHVSNNHLWVHTDYCLQTEIEPDLILAANIHKGEVIPQLERLGFTVLALDPKTLDEVLEAINLIGRFTGKTEEAAQLTAEMENRIKAVTDKTSALSEKQRPSVFYVLWYDPLSTVAPGTRIHDLLVKAGGKNIAGGLSGYPDISLEAVISMNPQVIIADVGHGSGEELNYQYVLTEKRFKDIDARRSNRIYKIDSDLVSRPGPRIIEGLESFAKFIHPELFP
ncbi:Vitamin B12-binding protein [subsurface metagenome]